MKSENAKRMLWPLFGLICCAAAFLVWGVFIEPGLLVGRQITRSAWPGSELKIAFFSDLHAGAPHINRKYIADLIERIRVEAPDIILIGGDLLINGIAGGKHMPIAEVAPLLGKLKAPLGVFAVLGNHDWWNNGEEIAATLRANGIEVLENRARLIERSDQTKFWLVGIGDDYTKHSDGQLAFSTTDASWPKVVFMHDPGALLQTKERFNVAFAGHLHGGQIFVPGYGAIVTPGRAPRAWAKRDWTEFELGSLFVSSGVGTSILPIRANVPPEFVIAILRP